MSIIIHLTLRIRGFIEKLRMPKQDKECSTFNGTERLIAVFTKARHGSIARAT
jgi:hypothetical protein